MLPVGLFLYENGKDLYTTLSLRKSTNNSNQIKNVLVIDQNQEVDWAKYLGGRSINNNQFSINVHQASYSQITLQVNSENSEDNILVNISSPETKTVKQVKPDFVVVRQLPCSESNIEKRILIGLKYARVPSINTLHSCFNMADRSWTYSQLVRVQSKLGKDKFPLIRQTFFPDSKSMEHYIQSQVNLCYPVMVKVGSTPSNCINLHVTNSIEFNEAVRATACK